MEIVDGHRLLLMSLGSWSVLWVSLKFLKKYCMVRAKRSRCEIRLDPYWVSTRTGSILPQDYDSLTCHGTYRRLLRRG